MCLDIYKALSTTPECLSEVTFGMYLRMGLVARGNNNLFRGLQFHCHPPDLQGGERLRLNQSPLMANE